MTARTVFLSPSQEYESPVSHDERERARANISNDALLSALDRGVGLGEWLVAGPELMKKLNDGRGLNRTFADTVIAWYRTGLNQPLAKEDALRLWADTCPSALRERLSTRSFDDQVKLFEEASAWACERVIGRDLYEQALVTRSADGYGRSRLRRGPDRPES